MTKLLKIRNNHLTNEKQLLAKQTRTPVGACSILFP